MQIILTKASVFNFKFDRKTFPPNMPTFKFSKSKSSIYLPKYLFSNDATIPSNMVEGFLHIMQFNFNFSYTYILYLNDCEWKVPYGNSTDACSEP